MDTASDIRRAIDVAFGLAGRGDGVRPLPLGPALPQTLQRRGPAVALSEQGVVGHRAILTPINPEVFGLVGVIAPTNPKTWELVGLELTWSTR